MPPPRLTQRRVADIEQVFAEVARHASAVATMDEARPLDSAYMALVNLLGEIDPIRGMTINTAALQAAGKDLRAGRPAWKRIDEAQGTALLALMEAGQRIHDKNIQKTLAGLDHPDPTIRAAWREAVDQKTPAETFHLVQQMKSPPGKKGRPAGSKSAAEDEQALAEIARRIASGQSLAAARKDVARALGRKRRQGTVPSIIRRLDRLARSKPRADK